MFLALLVFTIVITSPRFGSVLVQKPSEVETMKQGFVRVRQVLDAPLHELEAIEAATQAKMQAEDTANEQRLEQERHLADRERKEAEKQKAELEH